MTVAERRADPLGERHHRAAYAAHRALFLGLVIAILHSASARAHGQDVIDFSSPARMHLGPIALTPEISINTLGVDNNVFNDADDPKRDMTGGFVPSAVATFRAGRMAAQLKSDVSLIYFKRYTNQRAINTTQDVTIAARASRVTPFARLEYVNARERPSIEIDSRVRRHNTLLGGGVDIALGVKLSTRLEAHQLQTTYEDTVFAGSNLQALLNERAIAAEGSLRYELTPLTRLMLVAVRQQDRFEFTPSRDASSFRIGPGVEFAPTALISGRATVGVRSFNVADQHVRDFTGVVAAIDLAYTLRGATQFGIRTDRDVAYSFSPSAPYYILTRVGGTVTQRLTHEWELTAFAERQRLKYTTSVGTIVPTTGGFASTSDAAAATEPNGVPLGVAGVYGTGVGYRFGRGSRIGFIVDYSNRPAGLRGEYTNLRAYTTINYGF